MIYGITNFSNSINTYDDITFNSNGSIDTVFTNNIDTIFNDNITANNISTFNSNVIINDDLVVNGSIISSNANFGDNVLI